jgi:hypothetical protein
LSGGSRTIRRPCSRGFRPISWMSSAASTKRRERGRGGAPRMLAEHPPPDRLPRSLPARTDADLQQRQLPLGMANEGAPDTASKLAHQA